MMIALFSASVFALPRAMTPDSESSQSQRGVITTNVQLNTMQLPDGEDDDFADDDEIWGDALGTALEITLEPEDEPALARKSASHVLHVQFQSTGAVH